MATPPTRVGMAVPASGNYTTTTSPKTSGALPALVVGDVIVVVAGSQQAGTNATVTPTCSAGSVTWTLQASQMTGTTNQSGEKLWTGVVGAAAAAGATISLARINTGTTLWWGFSATVWRGVSAVANPLATSSGTSNSIAQATTASLSANSAYQVAINDWNATTIASPTWQVINGAAMTGSLNITGASHATALGAYRDDVGTAGTKTVGMTTPATLRWVMVGIELVGTTSGGGIYVGDVSASIPRVTSSIAGTTTVPTSAGSVSAATPKATATIAGTTTSPTSTGNVSATAPVVTASIAGTTTVPTYTGTLTGSTIAPTAAISGTATAPGSTGSINATTALPTAALTGTTTPPVYSGPIAASTPPVTGSMAGTSTAPTYSGTVTASVPPTRATIAGTVTIPAGSATLSGTVPRVTGSMSGTVTAPTWGGTLAAQLARTSTTMLGTVTGPVFVGTFNGTLPKVTGTLAGTTSSPTVTGTLSGFLPRVTSSMAGAFVTDPDYVPPSITGARLLPPRFVARQITADPDTASTPARFTTTPPTPNRYSPGRPS